MLRWPRSEPPTISPSIFPVSPFPLSPFFLPLFAPFPVQTTEHVRQWTGVPWTPIGGPVVRTPWIESNRPPGVRGEAESGGPSGCERGDGVPPEPIPRRDIPLRPPGVRGEAESGGPSGCERGDGVPP